MDSAGQEEEEREGNSTKEDRHDGTPEIRGGNERLFDRRVRCRGSKERGFPLV